MEEIFLPAHLARIHKYTNFVEIKGDLARDRIETRRTLKHFFRNMHECRENKLTDQLIKSVVHGLAEEDLPQADKIFCQALLFAQPEIAAPHLIGGLQVAHKTTEGGQQRADAIKRVLRRKRFATQQTANNLIAALEHKEIAKHAKELLQHPNYATQATANNLIAALKDPEASKHAKELLQHPNYATQATANNLLMLIETKPESEETEQAIQTIEHANYLGKQEIVNKIINHLVFRLGAKKTEQIASAQRILSRLKDHKSVRNALNAIINQPPRKPPKVKIEFRHLDGKTTEIDHILDFKIVEIIRQLLSQSQGAPKKKKH